MAGETVLVIDDEIDICNLIELYLVKNNINVVTANNGTEALNAIRIHKPDLIVLDVLLPDTDGFELCKELRKNTTSPILFLSCKNDDIDKILGLTVGGDDYISKPFSPSVLVARIKAHLRRNQMVSTQNEPQDNTLSFPGLAIDSRIW
ncbi:TPA: response regulator transcription factor [bacterium]|nr:response regulator transcription factor [bacterium]